MEDIPLPSHLGLPEKKRRSQGTYLRVPMMELLIPWWTSNQKSMGSPAVNPPVGVGSEIWAPKKTHRLEQTAKGAEISSTQTNRGSSNGVPVVIFVTLEVFGLGRSEKNSCYQTSYKKMHPGGRIPSLMTIHSFPESNSQTVRPWNFGRGSKGEDRLPTGPGFIQTPGKQGSQLLGRCVSHPLSRDGILCHLYWSWDWCNRSLVEEIEYVHILYIIYMFLLGFLKEVRGWCVGKVGGMSWVSERFLVPLYQNESFLPEKKQNFVMFFFEKTNRWVL